jgi:hypothetical protein
VVSVMLTPFWPSSVAPTHAKAHAHAHAHARIASTSNDRRMVTPPTPAARSNNEWNTRTRDETRRQRTGNCTRPDDRTGDWKKCWNIRLRARSRRVATDSARRSTLP